MNLVDSSGWLAYLTNGRHADFFAPVLEDTEHLLVSTINLYEVFKKVLQQRGEGPALQCVALMQQAKVIELDDRIALEAAQISVEHELPMADSLILVTASIHDATLWTQDNDFRGFDRVRFPL